MTTSLESAPPNGTAEPTPSPPPAERPPVGAVVPVSAAEAEAAASLYGAVQAAKAAAFDQALAVLQQLREARVAPVEGAYTDHVFRLAQRTCAPTGDEQWTYDPARRAFVRVK